MSRPALPRAAWQIPLLYFLFIGAEFLTVTAVALDLAATGYSAFAIGIGASALWAGIFTSSLAAHRLVLKLGSGRALCAANLLAPLALAGLILMPGYVSFLIASALIGLAGGVLWVTGEAWLAGIVPADKRGFYVGLFETAVGLGMVCGPLLVALCTIWDIPPLPLGLAVMLTGTLGTFSLLGQPEPPEPPAESGTAPAALPWALFAISGLSGLMESGSSAILPTVSVQLGFSVEAGALLGTVVGLGSALLQFPAGTLADRLGQRRLMLLCWTILAIAGTALALTAAQPGASLWICGFIFGGVGGAVYTALVVDLGHRLGGPKLVRAMGWMVTCYTAGTMVGPALGGWLFDRGGLTALALAILAGSILGGGISLRVTRRAGCRTVRPAGSAPDRPER